ncbi:hypothetical protein AB4212_01320, partial [Streptomyces sp. 2MCAF27]
PTPALRVLAAWEAAVEAFDGAGAGPPAPAETLVEAGRALAASNERGIRAATASLALIASRARYCEPTEREAAFDPALTPMSPQEADIAWLHSETIRSGLPSRRRFPAVMARLLPRALRRAHRARVRRSAAGKEVGSHADH